MLTLGPKIKVVLLCLVVFIVGLIVGAAATDYLQDRYNNASALAARFMALNYLKQHDIDRALAFTHQSIVLNPDNYSGYFLLGNIYAGEGKNKLAIEMYEKALAKTYAENQSFIDFAGKVNPTEFERKRIQEKINQLKLAMNK